MEAKRLKIQIVRRFKRSNRPGPHCKKALTLPVELAERAESAARRRQITVSELVCTLIESYVADEHGNKGTGRKYRRKGPAEAQAGDDADGEAA